MKKALLITATAILFTLAFVIINKITPVQSSETNNKTEIVNNNCPTDIQERYIRGDSLSPFLKPEDKVQVDYAYYKCHEIQQGDLVIYKFEAQNMEIIKFVRAIPGDAFTVDEEKNVLLINNEVMKNAEGVIFPLSEQAKKMLQLYEESLHGKLTEDLYLIFGNHPDTSDSTKFGPVQKKDIIGKVILKN